MIKDSSVHQSALFPSLTSAVRSCDCTSAAPGSLWLTSCTEPQLFSPQPTQPGVPLLAPWHNWQTVRCHLTLLFQCGLFPSTFSQHKKGGGGVFFSDSGLLCCNRPLTVWLKKLPQTELHISGSGSANVGDRGIWGLKPLYLPLYKSCFIAYTSALANMICIVTSLPAG